MEADEPRIVAGQNNDDCVVFAFSDRLVSALCAVRGPRLSKVAGLWSQLREREAEVLDAEVADEILGDLTRLARAAEWQGSGVYRWVALVTTAADSDHAAVTEPCTMGPTRSMLIKPLRNPFRWLRVGS
ncbi:hypothetical protein [Streptomyces sp. NPDC088183]|uniref:hypothetical protein n=1 Tax=Streptomyces sp. NPDC088183 TaxID=3160992 RepID=UPI003445C36E